MLGLTASFMGALLSLGGTNYLAQVLTATGGVLVAALRGTPTAYAHPGVYATCSLIMSYVLHLDRLHSGMGHCFGALGVLRAPVMLLGGEVCYDHLTYMAHR